ncbi:zinc dependent phospholipase C family protein [Cesiribacter andamanensis]|uniref:S1/P1 Nuclease n=1 Tax=Cesiribacter andamanensis AMV16 TaxID=1279009 RepID=M7NTE0_9BACT|nr:zinc dependent phospholipase C family protein [Cesiribacter andamanensis]EMR01734.1 hypothetical protein ADICEAN_03130 [Cesiribacter andamanensis AMV16]
MKKGLLLLLLIFLPLQASPGAQSRYWGFFAHQLINRLAVFSLPPEMLPFYKRHIQYLTENAVNPDRRRYAVEGEAERHYIDIDVYGDSAVYTMPRYWSQALELYSEDTLRAYGIVPWHVHRTARWLTEALREKNTEAILRLSADLGHYIADANVPLHTTVNYNGQLTGQRGIHGFWESRLPELFVGDYSLWVGKARYIDNTQLAIWDAVVQAHQALDSVLVFERELTARYPEAKKWVYEERNGLLVRSYSREFSADYQRMLGGQVERQLLRSIRMVSSFWYTCWVDAGQPDLSSLLKRPPLSEEQLKQLEADKLLWQQKDHSLQREHEH